MPEQCRASWISVRAEKAMQIGKDNSAELSDGLSVGAVLAKWETSVRTNRIKTAAVWPRVQSMAITDWDRFGACCECALVSTKVATVMHPQTWRITQHKG